MTSNNNLNGVQIVLQTEDGYPYNYECDGFSGLPILNPVFIAIISSGGVQAQIDAQQIRQDLTNAILNSGSRAQKVTTPCYSQGHLFDCMALQLKYCSKLLIWVGDDQPSTTEANNVVTKWINEGSEYQVLPVFPTSVATSISSLLPTAVKKKNAIFWTRTFDSVISSVFSLTGLTSEENRIFISYRRIDTNELAAQLFDELTHRGFDVFLDRFGGVPPGVDFQARLTQELADKSMVVLLESINVPSSEWTQYELDFTKLHRLGLVSLQVPNLKIGSSKRPVITRIKVPEVDQSQRVTLRFKDFVNKDATGKLTEDTLGWIVNRIIIEHDKSILRRRQYLRDTLAKALTLKGVYNAQVGSDGLLHVSSNTTPTKEYSISMTTRPPVLPDFHTTDIRRIQTASGVIIGPATFLMSAGKARMDWLCQISKVQCFDEAQINNIAENIATGSL